MIVRVRVGRISGTGVQLGGQRRTPHRHAVRGFGFAAVANAVSAILTTSGTAHIYLFSVHHLPNAAF